MTKMDVTVDDMKRLLEMAQVGDRIDVWADVAMDWMHEANKRLQDMNLLLKDIQKWDSADKGLWQDEIEKVTF